MAVEGGAVGKEQGAHAAKNGQEKRLSVAKSEEKIADVKDK